MIKRRFYKRGGDSSDSSSSSSDSDSDSIPEVEEEEEEDEQELQEDEREEEEDDDEDDAEVELERAKSEKKRNRNKRNRRSPSPALLTSEEENIERDGQKVNAQLIQKANGGETKERAPKAEKRTLNLNDSMQVDFADYVLKCKSVFKCSLCPRIVCLSEDTIKAHLSSKRHARSKKLLGEGRLKFMLNSDGEIEEDLETHAERHVRTIALAQELVVQAKKDKGRQRQSRRRKKKQLRDSSNKGKPEQLTNNPQKKRRKNEV